MRNSHAEYTWSLYYKASHQILLVALYIVLKKLKLPQYTLKLSWRPMPQTQFSPYRLISDSLSWNKILCIPLLLYTVTLYFPQQILNSAARPSSLIQIYLDILLYFCELSNIFTISDLSLFLSYNSDSNKYIINYNSFSLPFYWVSLTVWIQVKKRKGM